MRAPLLALLLAPSLAFSGDLGHIPANWNQLEVPLGEEEIVGLREMGFRLEPDGRVLDLELNALDAAGLMRARQLFVAAQRRQKLERLRAFLATQPQDAPLSPDARRQALQLADGSLFEAVNRNEMTARALSRMARMDLNAVARVFDGNAAAGGASVAVVAPETAPHHRPRFPYLTAAEQQLGERLQAAAVTQLSNYERGRLILSRLNGALGTPELPPIVVEPGGSPARYDVARRVVVLDRDLAIEQLLVGVLPVDRASRRRELERPDAVARALAADPNAVSRLMAHSDIFVAHELTHAWQDRRDSLWRRARRGHAPMAVPFEYEEEANLEKNLYIHDVLRGRPGANIDPMELQDYRRMMIGYDAWRQVLRTTYDADNPNSSVQDLSQLDAALVARRSAVLLAVARTEAEQKQKTRMLAGIDRGRSAIDAVQTAHSQRVRSMRAGALATASGQSNSILAIHFLEVASQATTRTDRIAALESARAHAEASGDTALIQRVQSQAGMRP